MLMVFVSMVYFKYIVNCATFKKKRVFASINSLFVQILVKGTSSTFIFASIWGPSTRELASNGYSGTRCFTIGTPGGGNFSSLKPRSLCNTPYISAEHFYIRRKKVFFRNLPSIFSTSNLPKGYPCTPKCHSNYYRNHRTILFPIPNTLPCTLNS